MPLVSHLDSVLKNKQTKTTNFVTLITNELSSWRTTQLIKCSVSTKLWVTGFDSQLHINQVWCPIIIQTQDRGRGGHEVQDNLDDTNPTPHTYGSTEGNSRAAM